MTPGLAPAPRSHDAAERPLRIALVAASLDIIGGHGVQMLALQRALRSDGHDVSFIPVNPRLPGALAWVRKVPYARTVANQLLYLPSLQRLHAVDVVHVFSASYWSFLLSPVPAIVAARCLGKRIVLNYHSGEADDHLANWGAMVHPWLKLADEIVVPSRYLQRVFARHGYRARVIPNIVDPQRFAYRERRPLLPQLVSNRNLEPYYRVDVTIRAFALLKQRRPDATLTIAGSGSQEGALRHLVDALGVDGVTFVGSVPPDDMPALFARGSVFVNASTLDNQPVSILEAFASGLPVVSTGAGDIAAMLGDGAFGVLVPPEDPVALCAGVVRVLDCPDGALAMARRAHEELARYTWPGVAAAWSSVYRTCDPPHGAGARARAS